MTDEQRAAPSYDLEDSPPDLASRELCPDGACIGVIGADGRCKACGATAEQPAAAQPATDPEATAEPAAAQDDGDDDAAPDLASRELCADGTCIGVLDPHGRCRVCRKTAEDVAHDEEERQRAAMQPAAEEDAPPPA